MTNSDILAQNAKDTLVHYCLGHECDCGCIFYDDEGYNCRLCQDKPWLVDNCNGDESK